MKIENTTTEKTKFFLHYFNSPAIWRNKDMDEEIDEITWEFKNFEYLDETDYLELKPLSVITEIELFEVLNNSDKEYTDKEYGKLIKVENIEMGDYFDFSCRMVCEKKNYKLQSKIYYEAGKVDVLRKLGFVTPYLNLSIIDLINYGWVKLAD